MNRARNRHGFSHGLDWKNGWRMAREKPPEKQSVAGDSCTSVHNAFPQHVTGR
jgi:hypothetical protein